MGGPLSGNSGSNNNRNSIESLVEYIKNLVVDIKNLIKNLVEDIKNLMENLVEDIKSLVNSLDISNLGSRYLHCDAPRP